MSEWKKYRIKDIARYIGSGTTPSSNSEKYYAEEGYMWVNTGDLNNDLVFDCKQRITDAAINDYKTLRFYPHNTILEAMYGATIGKVGLLQSPATVNQACCAIVPFEQKVSPKFLLYYLIDYKDRLISESCGGTQPNVNQKIVTDIPIKLPSLDTQRSIVSYLDSHVVSIDKRVSLLTTKRDHYLRLKAAIINRAVTQGLNSDVKMKDSGIEWIGMIPEHWEIRRIKEISKMGSGTTPRSGEDKYYENGIYPWLNTSDVQDCEITKAKFYITDKAMHDYSVLKFFPTETVLLAMYGGGTIGNVGIMMFPSTINQACCAMIPNSKKCFGKYLYYYLRRNKQNIISLGFGGTQVNLSQALIAQLPIVLPTISEQQTIATLLDEKCAKIDAIVENLNQQIEKHKLLKRALINEVITGQRAV